MMTVFNMERKPYTIVYDRTNSPTYQFITDDAKVRIDPIMFQKVLDESGTTIDNLAEIVSRNPKQILRYCSKEVKVPLPVFNVIVDFIFRNRSFKCVEGPWDLLDKKYYTCDPSIAIIDRKKGMPISKISQIAKIKAMHNYGYTNSEIANELKISVSTVSKYLN